MTKKQFLALAGIFILGAAIMCASVFVKKNRKQIEWNGKQYQIENVNALDAKFAHSYNRMLDKTGDAFVAFMWATACSVIIISFFAAKDKKTAFKKAFFEAYTLGICGLYSVGIYIILKSLAGRIRPYMYFANPSEKGIAKGDFNCSWPSGHSSNVFFAFAFILAWFTLRHAESKFKKPVLTVTFLVCIATMVMRMLSGNHFLTDVLSGAALGFGISYAMAYLCNSIVREEI